jgi:hypothetical protein
MQLLLTFLAALFYSALAIIFAVAFIEARRAEAQSDTESKYEKPGQKAA